MATITHSTSLTIRKHLIGQPKPKGASPYDDCINWIYNKQGEIEGAKYGRNRASLEKGTREQEARAAEVEKYKPEVDRAISRTNEEDKKANLQRAYNELKEISERKLNCLRTMMDITSLEEHCAKLSRNMDLTSVKMVTPEERERALRDGHNILGFIAPSSQDCVFAVQDNWAWVVKLVKCIDTHLKNGSDYHQFFHEVDETAPWMATDLKKIQASFDSIPLTGEYSDAQRILKELEDMKISLTQWQTKTDRLWEKSGKIVPVHYRTEGIPQASPARIIADYATSEFSVREGEDVLLLDNSDEKTWTVRTCTGVEGRVPALCVLIPGPYKAATEAANKLRLQLLTEWTNSIKHLGKRLLCFMLLVFKPHYEMDEIQAIRSIKRLDKQELLRILDVIEDTLRKHWSDHEGFINLQERILALRMILEEVGDDQLHDETLMNSLVVQITSLEKVMDQYKNIYGDWETLKTSVEASQNPDLMLIVDKWQQLQFVTKDFFSKFWKNELPMDKQEKSIMTLKTMTLHGEKLDDPVTEETMNMDDSWEETRLNETKYITERELNRAKKVDLQDALGTAETVDSRIHRSKIVNIHDALGGEQGSDSSGWDEVRTVETTSQVYGERPLGRSRQVDITTALGGGTGGTTTVDGSTIISGGSTTTISGSTTVVGSGTGVNGSAGSGGFGVSGVSGGSSGSGVSGVSGGSGGSGGSAVTVEKTVRRVLSSQLSTGSVGEVFDEGMFEEGVSNIDASFHGSRASSSEIGDSEFGYATMTRTAETEQIQSAELEEKKTFIIRSVVNPYDDNIVSLQEAIIEGFIRPTQGDYFNPRTGQTIPIPEAMSKGLIKVAFTTTKRGQEKRSSIGVITVKTIREPIRPYLVKTVVDPQTNEQLTQQEAAKRGILFEQRGIFINTKTGEKMLITEAIDRGLMNVQYLGDAPAPEVIATTYAVRAVVDLRMKKVITFSDAVRKGIIDRESGAYKNTQTGESMYVGDAIMRGFLKARKIDRTASLDIDPSNKMLVDKTETIRRKLLQPLKVISAFKRAGKMAHADGNNN